MQFLKIETEQLMKKKVKRMKAHQILRRLVKRDCIYMKAENVIRLSIWIIVTTERVENELCL